MNLTVPKSEKNLGLETSKGGFMGGNGGENERYLNKLAEGWQQNAKKTDMWHAALLHSRAAVAPRTYCRPLAPFPIRTHSAASLLLIIYVSLASHIHLFLLRSFRNFVWVDQTTRQFWYKFLMPSPLNFRHCCSNFLFSFTIYGFCTWKDVLFYWF